MPQWFVFLKCFKYVVSQEVAPIYVEKCYCLFTLQYIAYFLMLQASVMQNVMNFFTMYTGLKVMPLKKS